MSDDPTPHGDGDPIPTDADTPDPIGVGDHVSLLTDHDGERLHIPRREMLLVQHINDDGTADCRIARKIRVPLTDLRRWQ